MSVSLIKPQYHGFSGLVNYGPVPIPGTTIRAFFGVHASKPRTWAYTLWTEDDESCVSYGSIDVPEGVTPEQVACIVFILDVEHAS